jgi:short-chain fatty acids transporter
MEAAHSLKVHLGWVLAAYDLGEALANLVQPFWMLPILGLFQLGARDIMGYTLVVFRALVPTALLLVTLLGLIAVSVLGRPRIQRSTAWRKVRMSN